MTPASVSHRSRRFFSGVGPRSARTAGGSRSWRPSSIGRLRPSRKPRNCSRSRKSPGDLGGRGRLHSREEREIVHALIDEAVSKGVRSTRPATSSACPCAPSQRWRQQLDDRRNCRKTAPPNRLSGDAAGVGSRPIVQQTPRQRRQSPLRGALPHNEVPPRLPVQALP